MASTDAPVTPPRTSPLWWALLVPAAGAVVVFAVAAGQRVFYPHELEWMEGALADHAARVADGLPLYCEPTAEHVPFLYAPLLFWLGALGIKLGIDGVVTLRLVAAACTVGCAMLIGHWVRVETRRVIPGLVATGLFLAGYGWLAWWYDLARNDSLFVLLTLLTAYTLRHGGRAGWLWAGLLAAVALLAKQSAVMWLPAVGVGMLCYDWRRAVRFGAVAAAAGGLAIGMLHLGSDGWSTFYLFEMPRFHGWVADRRLGYWTEDLLPIYPLILLGLLGFVAHVRAAPRPALFLAALGSGGLICSWFSRMHVGGFDNVMMYGFAAACVLGGVAAASEVRWLRIAAPALLIAQFAWLGQQMWQRGTSTLLPSTAHARAHEQLRAFVERQDGPVWIPGHGHISYRAGKGSAAHGQAIFDLLQLLPPGPLGFDLSALGRIETLDYLSPRARGALVTFFDSARTRLEDRHYAAIVADMFGPLPGADAFGALFAAFLGGYRRATDTLLDEPAAIDPLLGYHAQSPYALIRK